MTEPARTRVLHLLSAGAAQGIVTALTPEFTAAQAVQLAAAFGAVGAMRARLLAGDRCDCIILSRALIDALAAEGRVQPASIRSLGRVTTGVAVVTGAAAPSLDNSTDLRTALLAASSIYFPDPQQATAGIHFAKVMDQLGISETVSARLRPHPNGATAMRAMAASKDLQAIGCTQVTEIRNTPGVMLVGPLPIAHALATEYAIAVTAGAAEPDAAARFVAALTSDAFRDRRSAAGFD